MNLQRVTFLRGVNDPSREGSLTTTFYRPRHNDLRFEDGFVVAKNIYVPLTNVVELHGVLEQPEVAVEDIAVNREQREHHASEEPADVEEAPVRRRGRPRKQES